MMQMLIITNDMLSVVEHLCRLLYSVYAFPQAPAARIALSTVRAFLEDPAHRSALDMVLFCTFARRDAEIYRRYMPRWFPISMGDYDAAFPDPDAEAAFLAGLGRSPQQAKSRTVAGAAAAGAAAAPACSADTASSTASTQS